MSDSKPAPASSTYLLNDGLDITHSLINSHCSKACCSQQYPFGYKLKVSPYICGSEKFVPSSYMCNNALEDSGCLCMTQANSKYLGNRGNNA